MSEQGVLRALQRRSEKADVEAFTPHDFRRTFIVMKTPNSWTIHQST